MVNDRRRTLSLHYLHVSKYAQEAVSEASSPVGTETISSGVTNQIVYLIYRFFQELQIDWVSK